MALIVVGTCIAAATLIVLLLAMLGDLPSLGERLQTWCVAFGLAGVALMISARRRPLGELLVAGAVIAAIFLAALIGTRSYLDQRAGEAVTMTDEPSGIVRAAP